MEPAPASPEQRIVDTITNYYSTVPGELDSAWPMMTVDYQVNHVGGQMRTTPSGVPSLMSSSLT